MAVLETYLVKGAEKEHFFDTEYKGFEKEVSPEELIEMIKSQRITVEEAVRRVKEI